MSIRDLVEDLTLPRNVRVETDEGTAWATEDALLAQLLEAVSSSVDSGSGAGGAPNTRNLINTDALHMLGMIVTQVGDWCRMVNAPTTKDAATDLRSWYDRYSAFEGDSLDAAYERVLQGWVNQIRETLIPPHRPIELFGVQCPGVAITDDEFVDSHSLKAWVEHATGDPVAKCVCGLRWRGWQDIRALSYDAENAQLNVGTAL
jgi:hypothetical protein